MQTLFVAAAILIGISILAILVILLAGAFHKKVDTDYIWGFAIVIYFLAMFCLAASDGFK